ncbi:serine hydrolase domain-containing protein [Limosilactobacillus secaliphilus]|nr:serine hydrolase domain-containing protein [Limosilactobacillus secaliphilus]
MTDTRYQHTIDLMNAMYQAGVVPGMSYVIFDHSQQEKAVVGKAQLVPKNEDLRDGMLYDLASLTKVVATTPVIAWLMQKHELRMDDPVQKYLPEIQNREVTIRHLLTHTAAIEGYIPHRNELAASDLIHALLTQEHIGHNLGLNIAYTDIGYVYLGLIAQRITGQPIQQLAQKLVIEHLGLEDEMTFHPDKQRAVPTEVNSARGGLIRGTVHDPKAAILGPQCGSAGLFASIDGLTKYGRLLIEDHLDGLLSEDTLQMMFIDQTPLSGLHNRAFGWKLLHSHADDHHTMIFHPGFTGTFMILDRQADAGLVFLSNRVHPTAANEAFLDWRARIIAAYLMDKDA